MQFANLFRLNVGTQVVQFEFQRQFAHGEPAVSVAGIALTRPDAEALRDLLTRLIDEQKAKET